MLLNIEGKLTHLNLFVLGCPKTGKTFLLDRFSDPIGAINRPYSPTLQSFHTLQHIKSNEDKEPGKDIVIQSVRLCLIDCGGLYYGLQREMMPVIDCLLLVYDTQDLKSFRECTTTYFQMTKDSGCHLLSLTLVGIRFGQVSTVPFAEVEEFTNQHSLIHYEIDATNPKEVSSLFSSVIQSAQERVSKELKAVPDESPSTRTSSELDSRKIGRKISSIFRKSKSEDSSSKQVLNTRTSKSNSTSDRSGFTKFWLENRDKGEKKEPIYCPPPLLAPLPGSSRHERDIIYHLAYPDSAGMVDHDSCLPLDILRSPDTNIDKTIKKHFEQSSEFPRTPSERYASNLAKIFSGHYSSSDLPKFVELSRSDFVIETSEDHEGDQASITSGDSFHTPLADSVDVSLATEIDVVDMKTENEECLHQKRSNPCTAPNEEDHKSIFGDLLSELDSMIPPR